jgi:hypothetical protein
MLQQNEVELTGDLEQLYIQRQKLQRAIDKIDERITRTRTNIQKIGKKDKLVITDHAVKRFRERVMDIPKQKVVKILGSQEMYDRYTQNGPGKYRIGGDYPHVVVVIEWYNVITCYLQTDIDEKLKLLQAYMDNWVDQRMEEMLGADKSPYKLQRFRKQYYK